MPSERELATALKAAGFRGKLVRNCPLAQYTSWRIGGPAELLAQPADREDLLLALRWATESDTTWRVLGNGSNLLVRDEGVSGVVIRVRRVLDEIHEKDGRIEAGAGGSFPALARFAASRGLAGLEFAAGIPGTVGGAIAINAGWHEYEVGNFVESVEFAEPDGTVGAFDRAACEFGYRRSAFRGKPCVVLGAALQLQHGDAGEIEERMDRFAASRKANQPTELPSCGSVFLQPEGDFAGRLIDAAGLKGTRVGDIQVSPKHANFFVNLGRGTAAEVLALVETVERTVEERFGVKLQREFELW